MIKIKKINLKKKGQGHIEIIFSFILFMGALVALFIFINPFAKTKDISVIGDVQSRIVEQINTDIGKLGIISKGNCYDFDSVKYPGNYVEILEFSGTNKKYNIYFGEIFSNSSPSKSAVCPSSNYSLGIYSNENMLTKSKIEKLVANYTSNYEGLKTSLGMTDDFAFSFRNLGQEVADLSGLPNDYISYYPLDANANDTNSKNNGILKNEVSFGTIGGRNAIKFDGVDDYVDFGTYDYNITNQFSGSFWFYSLNNSGIHYLISRGNNQPYVVWIEDGKLNSNLMTDSLIINENTWYHVVFTVGSNNNVYFNNMSHLGTTSGPNHPGKNTFLGAQSQPATGGGTPNYFFQGYIDDLKIYNRSLSSGEVSALYSGAGSEFNPGQTIASLSVNKTPPVGVDVEAKEFPVRVIDDNGNILELILNLRAWD